jgi:hypothetical protein
VDEAVKAGHKNRETTTNLSRQLRNEDFVGRDFRSWEQIRKAATGTYAEGGRIISSLVDKIGNTGIRPTSIKRTQCWSDDGDDYSRDREERGLPAWRGTHRARRMAPAAVKITIDVTTTWDRQSTDVFWRGAAAIAATKILEEAGYRVELSIAHRCDGATDKVDGIQTTVCVKESGDLLDVDTLATCCAGWFFRTVVFAALALYDGTPGCHFGFCRKLESTPDSVVAEGVWNETQAIDWIKATIAKLTGETV